ncbi:MAG: MinD/ParA family protein [Smithellaceae bacterium]|jgi:MinD-like ATPase involved in chromosome partitioning or flagellar assembly|nr:MinD/ParA family protein [Smithellaceae bacterium]
MPKIIAIHSFRGGTGKSNTTANLACLLAQKGQRVGIVDTDIQSPGIHVLFNLDPREISCSLNDFLWGKCEIESAAYDVSKMIEPQTDGKLFLIPSSIRTGDIARVLHYGYDINLLKEGYQKLTERLSLDYLFIDTHPGLNEETLMSIAIADILLIILRPDQQDYQGTAVTVEVSRQLEVPGMFLIVNKVPDVFAHEELAVKVASTYQCEVAGVLPHADEMMTLASSGIFSMQYPDHAVSREMDKIIQRITG